MDNNDQLTMDCIAARQAGMSYGQWKAWKALQERKDVPVPEPDSEPVVIELAYEGKKCEWCSKPLPANTRRRFCNDHCKQQSYYYRNYAEIQVREKARRDKRRMEREAERANADS